MKSTDIYIYVDNYVGYCLFELKTCAKQWNICTGNNPVIFISIAVSQRRHHLSNVNIRSNASLCISLVYFVLIRMGL